MSRSESARRLARARFERGHHVGCLPFGYDAGPDHAVPDPATAPRVAEAFRLAAEGKSLAAICAHLGRSGVRSRRGKRLGRSSVHALLANPFYAGRVRYLGAESAGVHTPIVSDTEYGSVQRKHRTATSVPACGN